MADRDHCVFEVPDLTFWKRKDLNAHLGSTLVDGVSMSKQTAIVELCVKWFVWKQAYFDTNCCFQRLEEQTFVFAGNDSGHCGWGRGSTLLDL